MFRLAISIVAVAYPIIVYFGLQIFPPSVLALFLAIVLLSRLGVLQPGEKRLLGPIFLLFLIYAVAGTVSGEQRLLLYYPVLVNGVLAFLFISSLRSEPLLLRLVRARNIPISQYGPLYLRRLTVVWACFLVINGGIALATVQMSLEAWVLYNGFIAYLAIGSLLVGEWLFRRWYKQRKGLSAGTDNPGPLGDVLAAEYCPEFVGMERKADGCRLHLRIDPELAWFEGHFPGQPVLPGIVQLHWAILAARQLPGIEGLPTAIRRLKFRHVLIPPAPVILDLARTGNVVSFSYHWQDTEYSNGRLHFGT